MVWYEDNESAEIQTRDGPWQEEQSIHGNNPWTRLFSTPDQVGIGHIQGSILPGIWLWNETLVDFIYCKVWSQQFLTNLLIIHVKCWCIEGYLDWRRVSGHFEVPREDTARWQQPLLLNGSRCLNHFPLDCLYTDLFVVWLPPHLWAQGVAVPGTTFLPLAHVTILLIFLKPSSDGIYLFIHPSDPHWIPLTCLGIKW